MFWRSQEEQKEWTVWVAPGDGFFGNLKQSLFGAKVYHCDKLTVGPGIFRLWNFVDDCSLYLPMQTVTAFSHNFGDEEREKEIEESLKGIGGGLGAHIPGFE